MLFYWVVEYGCSFFVKVLIECGVDVFVMDFEGKIVVEIVLYLCFFLRFFKM